MSQITSIVYRPTHVEAKPADHFSRISLDSAQLVAGYGIDGDHKGGHPNRQLNVMCQETLDQLAGEGFQTEPGQMGEQIIIGGLPDNLNALPSGTQLQLGDTAVIEVIEPRTGCDRFEAIQGHAPALAARRLGVMAKVLQSGTIRIGDAVRILEHV
jgi:MOSC domain-containing protein YiiM